MEYVGIYTFLSIDPIKRTLWMRKHHNEKRGEIFSSMTSHFAVKQTAIILFIVNCYTASAQLLPQETFENLKTDLISIFDSGKRPVSGTVCECMDTQGAIFLTGNQNDYAILGNGYFKVRDKATEKTYYTRYGRFFRVGDNEFITQNGDSVQLDPDAVKKLTAQTPDTVEIDLFYPSNGADVNILSNEKWESSRESRKVIVKIVKHVLEQNPVDTSKVINKICTLIKGGGAISDWKKERIEKLVERINMYKGKIDITTDDQLLLTGCIQILINEIKDVYSITAVRE